MNFQAGLQGLQNIWGNAPQQVNQAATQPSQSGMGRNLVGGLANIARGGSFNKSMIPQSTAGPVRPLPQPTNQTVPINPTHYGPEFL